MRIKSLYIKKYKILEEFFVHFDEGTNVNVIIGKNGAGKTTLFEAIILIFREISLANSEADLRKRFKEAKLQFEVNYTCKGNDIAFSCFNTSKERNEVLFQVNEASYELNETNLRPDLIRDGDPTQRPIFSVLPDHIVAYYSGESKRVISLFDEHKSIAYEKLKDGKDIPLRELINIDATSIAQVLLSLLIDIETAEEGKISPVLLEDEIVSGKISFKQPSWYKTAEKNFKKALDINFEDAYAQFNPEMYYAEGEVGQFVDDLTKFSQKDYKGDFISALNFKVKDIEFMSSEQRLDIENSLDFFKMLDHTYQAELVEKLTLQIHLKKSGITIDADNLSEGEHQIKLVLALNEIFKEKEALFLYDEPDTYLHPEWQILLMEHLVKITNSQVFVTTHSTIALNRIGQERNSQIFMLESGKLLDLPQSIKSFGASPEAILMNYQRVDEKLPTEYESKLNEIQQLLDRDYTEKAKALLEKLKEKYGTNNREIINLETIIEIKEL